MKIFAAKNKKYENLVETDRFLRRAISDIGGHCRALEVLFDVLSIRPIQPQMEYWNNITASVINALSKLYPMEYFPLFGNAIAYSFLSLRADEKQQICADSALTFQDLEEYGLIKLIRDVNSVKIKIPFIFVMCYLQFSTTNEYSKFWSRLLITGKMSWQSWEEFNSLYMAFRISLFSKLGISTIQLSKFLSGAKMNIPVDIILKIPKIKDIETTNSMGQYPSANQEEFNVGNCVLNAPNAPFDAFVYLDTSHGKLLIAQQMKLANPTSKYPQKLTNDSINEEYNKVNKSIASHIPNTKFFLVVVGRCDGVYDPERLPSNCAVVSRDEFHDFYGDSYGRYLND